MDSTARFLLGGALGAALGYLVSQKSQQRAHLGQPATLEQKAPPAARVEAPPIQTEPVPWVAPVSAAAPEAPAVEAPAWLIETPIAEPPVVKFPVVEPPVVEPPKADVAVVEVPAPAWEPAPSPIPDYLPTDVPPASVVEVPIVEAPAVETPVVEAPAWLIETPIVEPPAVEPPVAEATAVEAPVETPVETPAPAWEEPAPSPAYDFFPVDIPAAPVVEAPEPVAEPPAVEEPLVEAQVDESPVVEAPTPVWEPVTSAAREYFPVETPPAKVDEPRVTQAPPVLEWEPVPRPAPSYPPVETPPLPEVEAQEPALEAPVIEVPVAEAHPWVIEAPAVETTIAGQAGLQEAEELVEVEDATELDIVAAPDILDAPMPGSGWDHSATMVVEEDNLEDLLPEAPIEFAPMEAAEVERRPAGTWKEPIAGVWSEPETEELEVESVEVSLPEAEPGVLDEGIVEAPAEAVETVVEIPPVDDLKARIEETRRRIRQELEQPFMSADEAKAPDDDWTTAPAVPTPGEAAVKEPAAVESVESLVDSMSLGADAEVAPEEPVDYDSMKARIEGVRSRLKAKAFDAMMSGESSLLGRDEENAGHRRQVLPDVDSEVSETIESSLREEEV